MFDNMFFFIDPIIEVSEDDTCFVIYGETLFDIKENIGPGRAASSSDETKIQVPLDIAICLLGPDK